MSRIRTHTNPLALQHKWNKLNLNLLFIKNQPLDLEIGFGRGVFINRWARQFPNRNIIGIEIRKGLVHEQLQKSDLENLKIFNTNAITFINNALNKQSLENIFIFHPDPWFKNRHKKRKVISEENIDVFKQKLQKTGKIHVSTDVIENWDYFLRCFSNQGFKIKKKEDMFWSDYYQTHWSSYTRKIKRQAKFATFIKA